MYKRPQKDIQQSLFFGLADTLNPSHPLFRLANKINWQKFEDSFMSLYSEDNGRPAKSIRLMVGLILLRHIRNISDESVVLQWQENAYYQYFCGQNEFSIEPPCNASELVHFRKRIGEDGARLILEESILVNDDHDDESGKTVYIDSTVQEKNITFPTDGKLLKKIVHHCKQLSDKYGFTMRQSYTRVLKLIFLDQRFRNNPRNHKKAIKADRKLKTIAGRLVRELERNLKGAKITIHDQMLSLFHRVLEQKRTSKDKIYSLHEPEVECIGKGKEHKKYEFGNKVSIARTEGGLIVGAVSFRKEHDSKTIEGTLEQIEKNIGKLPPRVACDRGYRGIKECKGVPILIPDKPKKTDSYRQKKKKHKLFCQRAAIEPTIGHIKSDHRMDCNFLKGVVGDVMNAILSAAAFNFKRAMNALWAFIVKWIFSINWRILKTSNLILLPK
ncbi:MAG: IS5 family transposase [Proteocatella sp.]